MQATQVIEVPFEPVRCACTPQNVPKFLAFDMRCPIDIRPVYACQRRHSLDELQSIHPWRCNIQSLYKLYCPDAVHGPCCYLAPGQCLGWRKLGERGSVMHGTPRVTGEAAVMFVELRHKDPQQPLPYCFFTPMTFVVNNDQMEWIQT